jgi:hypothetical protein
VGVTQEEEAVVAEFAQVAREFISLMGRIEGLTIEQLVRESTSLLPRLYQLAFLLPCVEPESEEISKSRRGFEEWRNLREAIARVMGDRDCYNRVFNNYEDTEVHVGGISDDLADICHDLEGPLHRFENKEIFDAVWEWRFLFLMHTGAHITGAMRALYWLRRYSI